MNVKSLVKYNRNHLILLLEGIRYGSSKVLTYIKRLPHFVSSGKCLPCRSSQWVGRLFRGVGVVGDPFDEGHSTVHVWLHSFPLLRRVRRSQQR